MKVFLYGHYDSRGGTTAIEADNKEEADERYLYDVFCFGQWSGSLTDDERAQSREGCLSDYLGEFELEDAPAIACETGADLEDELEGVVIAKGDEKRGIPNFHASECGVWRRRWLGVNLIEETPTDPDFKKLRFIAKPEYRATPPIVHEHYTEDAGQELICPEGWYHPCWNDDAYTFILMPKKR